MHFAEVAILIRSGVGTRVATNTSFGGMPSQLASRLDPEASAPWRTKEDLHAQRTKGEESGAGDR